MAKPTPKNQGSPTKADYRTVDPFHAFAVLGRSVRDLLVKAKIIRLKPAPKASKSTPNASKHAAKASKPDRRRH